MNVNECIEETNGRELIKLINEKIKTTDLNLKLCEFDILPIPDKSSKFYDLVEQRYLLINKIMCKKFYFYWKNEFFNGQCNSIKISKEQIDVITMCILLINPNFSSAWSRRKEMAMIDLFHELEFNRLILSKHFKCEQAFIHRRWLIKKITKTKGTDFVNLVNQEKDFLIEFLSPKIKSNYYCWSYLIWLFDHFSKISTNFLNILNLNQLNQQLENMLYKNPSDNCVFHFRIEFLFQYFLKFLPINFEFLSNEISLIIDLILRFSHFSTTWNYGKYFLLRIKPFLSDFSDKEKLLNDLKISISLKIQVIYPKQNMNFDFSDNSSIKDTFISLSNLCCILNENDDSIVKYSKNFNEFIKTFC